MNKLLVLFFALVFAVCPLLAQQDSISTETDKLVEKIVVIDTAALQRNVAKANWQSFLTSNNLKQQVDIEVAQVIRNDWEIFLLLLLLLLFITLLKLSYANDFSDLFRSVSSANLSVQIFRTQTSEFKLSSILLYAISVVAMAVFVREVWLFFSPTHFLQQKISIATFIFLFTFFFLLRYILMQIVGVAFEVSDCINHYIFQLGTMLKTVGIAIVPALFVIYAAPQKYILVVTIIVSIISCVLFAMAMLRGLSTASRLMYLSIFHFLIYVCVQEILSVFLLIKLLTKTAT